MENFVLSTYLIFFKHEGNIDYYLKIISEDLKNNFNQKELNLFKTWCNKNVDLVALEFHLRYRHKDNILSFIFLRLSALAETIPQNQYMFINRTSLNFFDKIRIFMFAMFNIVLYIFKWVVLHREIKEYIKCKK